MNARRLSLQVCVVLLCASWACGDAEKARPAVDPAQALKQKITNPVITGPLGEAFDQLRKLGGVKIEPDWLVLGSAGVGRDTPASVEASEATVAQLLDIMLARVSPKGYPLAWYLDKDVVRVTTQLRVLYRRYMRSRASPGDKGDARRPGPMPEALEFEDAPLSHVIDFFKEITGVNFSVNWRALKTAGAEKETPVTLKVQGISIARALDLVTDQLNAGRSKDDSVYWVVNEGVVVISTGATLNTNLSVRVYDVGDLLVIAPDFPGPRISLDVAGNTSTSNQTSQTNRTDKGLFDEERGGDNLRGGREPDRREQRTAMQNTLITAIKDSIGEDMWLPNGKGSITMLNGRLIISQTPLGFKLLERAARR